jgi:hypothetical protein
MSEVAAGRVFRLATKRGQSGPVHVSERANHRVGTESGQA